MSLEEQQAVVKIGNEIIEIPLSSTALVQDQKKRLLGSVDLPALVDDLGRVGNFVRIAYNGVAGFTDLQISIREIGVDVTKLCDKSAVTVSKFKTASGSILEDLQGTYQFLIDGLEDIALVTLAAVADVAKDMASAADELQKEFSDEADKLEDILKKMMITKGSEHEQKEELEKTAQDLTISKEKAKLDRENAEKNFKLYEEKYNQAEAKQESLKFSASNPLKSVVNGFLAPVLGTDYQRRAQEAKEEKLKHLEEMKSQREACSKALQDFAEFSKRIDPVLDGRKVFDTDSDQRRAQEAKEEKLKHLEEMKSQREARSKALQDFAEFSKRIDPVLDGRKVFDTDSDQRRAQEAKEEKLKHLEEMKSQREARSKALQDFTEFSKRIDPVLDGRKVFDTDSDQRRAQEAKEEKLKHLEEMKSQREARSKALQDFAEFSKRIDPVLDGRKVFDTDSDQRRAQEAKEEKLKHLEEMKSQREARSEALQDFTEFSKRIDPVLDGRKVFDTDSDQRRAQEAKEEKLKHLEEMKSQREARSKALQDFAEFSKRIDVMMKAALFWKQMQLHCETLAKDKMKKIIEAGMKRPPADRLRVWTAVGFKKQAIDHYGRWVALDDVCGIYMRRIQETQKDLYGYLTENPTLQQARKNVRELAATFAKDLAAAQKAITDKEVEDNEMIKQLQEEISRDKSED